MIKKYLYFEIFLLTSCCLIPLSWLEVVGAPFFGREGANEPVPSIPSPSWVDELIDESVVCFDLFALGAESISLQLRSGSYTNASSTAIKLSLLCLKTDMTDSHVFL